MNPVLPTVECPKGKVRPVWSNAHDRPHLVQDLDLMKTRVLDLQEVRLLEQLVCDAYECMEVAHQVEINHTGSWGR